MDRSEVGHARVRVRPECDRRGASARRRSQWERRGSAGETPRINSTSGCRTTDRRGRHAFCRRSPRRFRHLDRWHRAGRGADRRGSHRPRARAAASGEAGGSAGDVSARARAGAIATDARPDGPRRDVAGALARCGGARDGGAGDARRNVGPQEPRVPGPGVEGLPRSHRRARGHGPDRHGRRDRRQTRRNVALRSTGEARRRQRGRDREQRRLQGLLEDRQDRGRRQGVGGDRARPGREARVCRRRRAGTVARPGATDFRRCRSSRRRSPRRARGRHRRASAWSRRARG